MNWMKTARGLHGDIVSCRTEDGLQLHGLYSGGRRTALLHTHGTASSFGTEDFEPHLARWAGDMGWGFLSCNNRGAHVLEDWQKSGAAVERFSDSPLDMKAWIGWLHDHGVSRVVLSGHSLGTEKIANFLRSYETPSVVGALLLAPSDSPGCQERWERESGSDYMNEAIRMSRGGRGGELMSDRLVHAGLLPMSAESYLDFFDEDSDLRRALPFRSGSVESLPVPCLAVVPSDDVWNVSSAEEYRGALETAGCSVEICQCNHDFSKFDLHRMLSGASEVLSQL